MYAQNTCNTLTLTANVRLNAYGIGFRNSMDYGPRRLRPIEYGPRRKRTMLNAAHILLQNPRTDVRGESINMYLFSE